MAGTSEKRAQMLNEWIRLELKYAEEYLSYEFHRQKVKELTERTAAEIRQRERADRDFERDEKAADLAQRKTADLAESKAAERAEHRIKCSRTQESIERARQYERTQLQTQRGATTRSEKEKERVQTRESDKGMTQAITGLGQESVSARTQIPQVTAQQQQQQDTARDTVLVPQSSVTVQNSVSDQPSVGSVGAVGSVSSAESKSQSTEKQLMITCTARSAQDTDSDRIAGTQKASAQNIGSGSCSIGTQEIKSAQGGTQGIKTEQKGTQQIVPAQDTDPHRTAGAQKTSAQNIGSGRWHV